MNKLHFFSRGLKLKAVAAASFIIIAGVAGCGGKSGPVGKVVDGYVSGASLFADMDGNGSCETDTGVKTNASGDFELGSNFNNVTLCAKGGIDMGTGQNFLGELKAPAGATQITPLSTLVQSIVQTSKGTATPISATAAATTIATQLGLSGIDILNTDPVAATATPQLLLSNVAVQTLLVEATKQVVVAATSSTATAEQTNALYSSAVAGLTSALVASAPVDGSNLSASPSLLTTAMTNTVTNVQADTTVAATVPGVETLTAATVADSATTTLTTSVSVALSTTQATTSTTAAATTTTAAATTTTAAATTTTAAATTTTAAATTTTAAATTTTAAATTTTAAATTTTAAATTTTAAATTTTAAATTTSTTSTTTAPTFAGVCSVSFGSAIGYVTEVGSAASCISSVFNVDGGGASVAVAYTQVSGKTTVTAAAALTCDPFGAPPAAGAATLTPCKL